MELRINKRRGFLEITWQYVSSNSSKVNFVIERAKEINQFEPIGKMIRNPCKNWYSFSDFDILSDHYYYYRVLLRKGTYVFAYSRVASNMQLKERKNFSLAVENILQRKVPLIGEF